MMGRCGTCRFWARNGDDVPILYNEEEYVEGAHRKCVAVIHGNDYAEDAPKATASTPAMVCDGSGYAAKLYTLPTFGCTMYQPQKEKAR